MANEEILELQIRDNAADAATGLLTLSESLIKVRDAIGKGLQLKNTVSSLEKLKTAVNNGLDETSVQRFERLATVLERLKTVGALKISGIKNIANQLGMADAFQDARENAENGMSAVAEAVDAGMENVESRTGASGNAIKNAVSGLIGKLKDVWSHLRDIDKESNKSGGSRLLEDLANNAKNLKDKLKDVLADFGRIVKYRAIRNIIKNITEGFSLGVENVYNYSKAIGSDLAPAMDSAVSVLLQFKNSIGAAVAPLIQNMIPVLHTVVNALIELINYVNQFLALMRGQTTWTKALLTSEKAYDKQTKKAKKASSAIKELLADWDELNIIQSDSGSGGGASTPTTDYSKMFEESSEFTDLIKNHFQDIFTLVKTIGAAVAAWKLSKLFTGFINKLFRIAAGGILIKFGIDLAYGAGFDAGVNGKWDAWTIIQAVVGSLASAIGGTLIATTLGLSGVAGFAIGLGIGVIATLYGYMKGNAKGQDAVKWGNLHYTAEEVKKYVRDQFTFDVSAEVDVLHTNMEFLQSAKDEADAKISEFEKTLKEAQVNVSLGVDADPNGTTVKDAVASAQEAVIAVQTELEKTEEAIEVGLKYLPYVNDEGADVSDDLLANIKVANKPIREYLFQMGKDLAKVMYEGEAAGWDEGSTKAALDLMAAQQKIYDEAERLSNEYKLEQNLKDPMKDVVKNGVIDKATAEAALEEQQAVLQEYRETALAEAKAEANQLFYLAGLAQAAANDALAKGELVTAQELQDSADSLLADAQSRVNDAEKSIDAKLEASRANINNEWIKLIKTIYGADITKNTHAYVNGINRDAFIDYIDKGFAKGGMGEAANYLRQTITNQLGFTDPDGFVAKIIKDNGLNVFDLLSKRIKAELYNSLAAKYGDEQASELIQQAFGLTWNDLEEIIPKDVEEDIDLGFTIEPELLNSQEFKEQMKQEIEDAMSDNFLSDAERQYFLDNLGEEIFGQMLEELGYKVNSEGYNTAVNHGMRQLASAGMSDVSYTPRVVQTEGGSAQTSDQMVTDMEAAQRRANQPQNELLNQLITIATQIYRKDNTVVVRPSSEWGRLNQNSNRSLDRVMG